jgi:hypothetical protein
MAPHQTFYLKADRSLLNPHESADWVTSVEKATLFGSEREAQSVKGQREDTSGVLNDKDECYFYVMRVAPLKQVQKADSGQSCSDVLINRAARVLPCTHATVASCVACEIKPLTQSWSTRRMSSMRSLIIELSLLRVSVFMTGIVNCSFASASLTVAPNPEVGIEIPEN